MTSEMKSEVESLASMAATVKPGASVQMSYEAPKNLAVGQYGVLKLSFSENYMSGSLDVEVRAEDGLRFITEISEKEFSLAGDAPKEWELDVVSNKDGIYYVSIFAQVNTPEGGAESRAFSARVDVGDITKADAHRPKAENGTLSTDGRTVVLEAEEIIR
jgi:hypothetical protein